MYNKMELTKLNAEFCFEHYHITDTDVEIANKWVDLIERTRDPKRPMPGDCIQLTTRYGDYYGHAHIDSVHKDGTLYICEQPYVPFCVEVAGELRFSTSGGAWANISGDLTLVGQESKTFCDWGHTGACAHGAIDFEATVNVWKYEELNSYFMGYSTKDWRKNHVSFCEKDPFDVMSYQYYGDGFAFKDELEYAAWLHTYKAVEFEGFWENQTVVFSYRPAHHLVTKDEWDALELPTDTRLMNGSILLVKYEYDDENHVLHEYRYGNSGELDWRTNRPYRVAYHEFEGKQTIREIHKRTAE